MRSASSPAVPEKATGALAAVATGLVLAAGACSFSYDAGDTPEEQLCNVLLADLDFLPDDFELEPLLEGAAADPTDVPAELFPIAFAYATHSEAYDQLGDFRPAIEFTAAVVDLSADDLLGPSTLSPTVLASALAVDDALRGGACAS